MVVDLEIGMLRLDSVRGGKLVVVPVPSSLREGAAMMVQVPFRVGTADSQTGHPGPGPHDTDEHGSLQRIR